MGRVMFYDLTVALTPAARYLGLGLGRDCLPWIRDIRYHSKRNPHSTSTIYDSPQRGYYCALGNGDGELEWVDLCSKRLGGVGRLTDLGFVSASRLTCSNYI